MLHGFKLREEFKDFSGGSVKCNMAGHSFDVKDGLDSGDGMIVTDDDVFASILTSYEPLEKVASEQIPESATPVAVPGTSQAVSEFPAGPPWIPQQPAEDQTPEVNTAPGTLATPNPEVTVTPDPEAVTVENTGQVPAEHADEPGTPEAAVAAGEAVSGSRSGSKNK